jgi:hypothetical protein
MPNACICGLGEMADFVRIFAQKVTVYQKSVGATYSWTNFAADIQLTIFIPAMIKYLEFSVSKLQIPELFISLNA